jgi:hypothetical protein
MEGSEWEGRAGRRNEVFLSNKCLIQKRGRKRMRGILIKYVFGSQGKER